MLSRVLIFLFGLVVLSLGITIVTHAGLGTGTVSSAAIVLSRQTGLSMGLFVFLTNVFFFVLQCLVDPKNLMVKAVKQLPVCAFFGAVFDVAMWVTSFLEPTNYGWAFMQVFLGTCLTGLGVSAMVFARLLVLPPEGFVIAVMHRFGGSFGTIRTSVDVFLVAISVSMSLFFFRDDLRRSRRNAHFRSFCRTHGQRFSQKVGQAFPEPSSDRLMRKNFERRVQKHKSFVKMRASQYDNDRHGRVAEWSNAPDSKSGIRLYRIVGSNPTPSASF